MPDFFGGAHTVACRATDIICGRLFVAVVSIVKACRGWLTCNLTDLVSLSVDFCIYTRRWTRQPALCYVVVVCLSRLVPVRAICVPLGRLFIPDRGPNLSK
ncbi:unnamed protein product [Ectocarpus fasciculatus]